MTENFSNLRGPSIVQSFTFFFSKRHSLQMYAGFPSGSDSTSRYSSFLTVTRYISLPNIHIVAFPQHLVHSRCASKGFKNQTRDLNLKVLSVKAPTGQTS